MAKSRPVPPVVVQYTTAAEMLDCSRANIYKLVEAGELRSIRIGTSKSVRVLVADVYRLIGLEAPEGDPDAA